MHFRLRDAELSDGEIPVLAAENQDIVPHNYYTVSQRVPSNLDTAVPGAARRCGIVLSLKFSWRRIFFL